MNSIKSNRLATMDQPADGQRPSLGKAESKQFSSCSFPLAVLFETPNLPTISHTGNILRKRRGALHIHLGPMFSGKSTTLLVKLQRESRVRRPLYINSARDTRSKTPFSTHNPLFDEMVCNTLKADFIKLDALSTLSDQELSKYSLVCIDEAQFFEDLVSAVAHMVDDLKLVVHVGALSGTYLRKPFGHTLELVPMCDSIQIIHDEPCAACANHGIVQDSLFSHRLTSSTAEIEIGGAAEYAPVCRECYVKFTRFKANH